MVSSKKTCIVSRDRGLVDLVRRRLKRTYGDMLVGEAVSYLGADVGGEGKSSPLPPPLRATVGADVQGSTTPGSRPRDSRRPGGGRARSPGLGPR